jgi:hypothetical protein
MKKEQKEQDTHLQFSRLLKNVWPSMKLVTTFDHRCLSHFAPFAANCQSIFRKIDVSKSMVFLFRRKPSIDACRSTFSNSTKFVAVSVFVEIDKKESIGIPMR